MRGVEQAPRDAKPFEWEPAPAIPALLEEEGPREAEPEVGLPRSWKRAPAEASSVVGASIPADVADFATVYNGASVQVPSHGYGVDRVAGMLERNSLAGLDKAVKASAVLASLDAAGVPIEDVIHDGLLRYKALVAFEAAKELELHQVRHRNQRRVEELKGANEEFRKKKQAEVDALDRESAAAMASLTRLKTRQRAEEERLYRTVSLFVEPLPARIVPMTPRTAEAPTAAAALPPADGQELKLVTAGGPGVTDAGSTSEPRGSGARKKPAEGTSAPSAEPDGQGVS
jgi:hypothetical protein